MPRPAAEREMPVRAAGSSSVKKVEKYLKDKDK
jgi:hypothetical protein